MNTYIYILKLSSRLYQSDAWTSFDNQCIQDHFERLKSDFEQGIVIHAGRTEDPNEHGFGVVIFKAHDFGQAIQYMQNDPAIIHGLMSGKCQPYRVAIH